MKYYSVSEFAKKQNLPERTVRIYCATGYFAGAFLIGNSWNFPEVGVISDSKKQKRFSENPLLNILKEQKDLNVFTPFWMETAA